MRMPATTDRTMPLPMVRCPWLGRRLYDIAESTIAATTQPTPQPSGDATFTAVYDEIIVGEGCTTPLCHGGGAGAGGLTLTSREGAYAALVDTPAAGELCGTSGLLRVRPGDPEASLLWSKVATRSPLCGQPMPIATMLDAAQVDQILRWIERGAPND